MTYPCVKDEFATIAKVAKGFSLARFGDGELKMCYGKGYARQQGSAKLAAELLAVLNDPHKKCIVGIPTMDPRGPKVDGWLRHKDRFAAVLNEELQYYSAFVTRPDSAPWIATQSYAVSIARLLQDAQVTVLAQNKSSMLGFVRDTARRAIHVRCPAREAYDVIDYLEQTIIETEPEVVVMSCGPTATCLANRLSARGIHAIDLGSLGGFLCKALAGELH